MGPQWAPLIPLSLVYMSSLARSLFTLIADPAALLIPALLIPALLIPLAHSCPAHPPTSSSGGQHCMPMDPRQCP